MCRLPQTDRDTFRALSQVRGSPAGSDRPGRTVRAGRSVRDWGARGHGRPVGNVVQHQNAATRPSRNDPIRPWSAIELRQ